MSWDAVNSFGVGCEDLVALGICQFLQNFACDIRPHFQSVTEIHNRPVATPDETGRAKGFQHGIGVRPETLGIPECSGRIGCDAGDFADHIRLSGEGADGFLPGEESLAGSGRG